MSLSLGRQHQLLEIFDKLVHVAEDELHFREKAKAAIMSRHPYTTFVECNKEALKIIEAVKPHVEKAVHKMSEVRTRWRKACRKSNNDYDSFWSSEKIDNPLDDPVLRETDDGRMVLLVGDGRYHQNEDEIDSEVIGNPPFQTHVETLRASLKLALTERELVQALTEAKIKLAEYVEAEKKRQKK